MIAWVDLKTLQWAYAHNHVEDVNTKYGCSVVRPTETRYKTNTTQAFIDNDKEILMNFNSEKHLTMFILRWTQ